MTTLLLTTIITSFLDSLNPFAISQQFMLQGTIKKRHHILYYIMTMFLTNYTCGVLAYYGLLNPILYFIYDMIDEHPTLVYITKLMIIFVLTCITISSLYRIKHPRKQKETQENPHLFSTHTMNPYYLMIIGFLTTISELSTSLPYFTFLAILFSYQLSILELFTILFLYNIIYCLPLFLMYFIYQRKQAYFDRFYSYIKRCTNRWIPYLMPILCMIVMMLIIYTL